MRYFKSTVHYNIASCAKVRLAMLVNGWTIRVFMIPNFKLRISQLLCATSLKLAEIPALTRCCNKQTLRSIHTLDQQKLFADCQAPKGVEFRVSRRPRILALIVLHRLHCRDERRIAWQRREQRQATAAVVRVAAAQLQTPRAQPPVHLRGRMLDAAPPAKLFVAQNYARAQRPASIDRHGPHSDQQRGRPERSRKLLAKRFAHFSPLLSATRRVPRFACLR